MPESRNLVEKYAHTTTLGTPPFFQVYLAMLLFIAACISKCDYYYYYLGQTINPKGKQLILCCILTFIFTHLSKTTSS